MSDITVQVVDSHGGTVTAKKDGLTGFIWVETVEGRTGRTDSAMLDPRDEVVKKWLKEVFPPTHLDILLDKLM